MCSPHYIKEVCRVTKVVADENGKAQSASKENMYNQIVVNTSMIMPVVEGTRELLFTNRFCVKAA